MASRGPERRPIRRSIASVAGRSDTVHALHFPSLRPQVAQSLWAPLAVGLPHRAHLPALAMSTFSRQGAAHVVPVGVLVGRDAARKACRRGSNPLPRTLCSNQIPSAMLRTFST